MHARKHRHTLTYTIYVSLFVMSECKYIDILRRRLSDGTSYTVREGDEQTDIHKG